MININKKKKPFCTIFNFQKKSENIQKFTICFFLNILIFLILFSIIII